MAENVTINIFTTDEFSEAVAKAVQGVQQAEPEAARIVGVRVIDDDQGRCLEVAPELVKLLVDFGWMPPVDGA